MRQAPSQQFRGWGSQIPDLKRSKWLESEREARGQERLDLDHSSESLPQMPSHSKTPPSTSSLNPNTYLTVVALKVVITVHGYHPHNVLTALKHAEPHGG